MIALLLLFTSFLSRALADLDVCLDTPLAIGVLTTTPGPERLSELATLMKHRQQKVRLRAANQLYAELGAHLDSMGVVWRLAMPTEKFGEERTFVIEPVRGKSPLNDYAADAAEKKAPVVVMPLDVARRNYTARCAPENFIVVSVAASIAGKPLVYERHEGDHLAIKHLREAGEESLFHGFVTLKNEQSWEGAEKPTDGYPWMSLEELYTYARDAEQIANSNTLTRNEWNEITTQNRRSAQRARRVAEATEKAIKELEKTDGNVKFTVAQFTASGYEYPRFEFDLGGENLTLDLPGQRGRELFAYYFRPGKLGIEESRRQILEDARPLLLARLKALNSLSKQLVDKHGAMSEAAKPGDLARAREMGRDLGRLASPQFRWTPSTPPSAPTPPQ